MKGLHLKIIMQNGEANQKIKRGMQSTEKQNTL